MKKVLMIVAGLVLISALFLTWSDPGMCAEKIITIRFAHELGPGHPKFDFGNRFKALVEARLKGRVDVRVYPSATLFNDVDALDAVQAGNLELAMPLIGNFAKWVPETKVLTLPDLMSTAEASDRIWAGKSKLGQYLIGKIEAKGFKYLGYTTTGGLYDGGIMTRKRVRNLNDIKGTKIRVHSPDFKDIVMAWNASPISMAASEISTALQQGTIDGAVSSIPYWTKCCMDTAPYFVCNLVVQYAPTILVANNTFWKRLPPDIRKVLEQSIDEATAETRKDKTRLDNELMTKYQVKDPAKKGIYFATNEEHDSWNVATMTVYPKYKAALGEELYNLAIEFMKEKPTKGRAGEK